jgi:hypothetical protein
MFVICDILFFFYESFVLLLDNMVKLKKKDYSVVFSLTTLTCEFQAQGLQKNKEEKCTAR